MAHGYYNLEGKFIVTATKAEAVDAWRSERGYPTGGTITPAVQDDTAVAPFVSGLAEAGEAYGTPPTYAGQLAELGITLPSGTANVPRGMQETAGFGPTIPSAARNVEQIQARQQYNVQAIQSQAGLANYIDPGLASFVGGEMPPGAITQGLFGGIMNLMSGIGGPTAEQYARMRELQEQGMSIEEARTQAMGEFYGHSELLPGMEARDRTLSDLEPRAGAFYSANSKPITLPRNAAGEVYLPPAFLKLSEQIQHGHRTDMEIAESLAERLMTAPGLNPITENPPVNILLNTGDAPNEAFVRIQQIILAYLEQEAARYPYDADIQAIYTQFKNAQSLEEFYSMLNYGPSDLHPNIWTRSAGLLNENVVDPEDVAASIISGQTFYNPTRNDSVISGGGGGGSYRPTASQSWGQAPGGLYLWRIGA